MALLLDTRKIQTSVIEFLIWECGHIGNIHKQLINFERKSLGTAVCYACKFSSDLCEKWFLVTDPAVASKLLV